jgi:probable F420-dependent oxidoreductase
MPRAFRFGVVFTEQMGGPAWADYARRLEGDGFSTLLVADHFANPMACGPLMLAAAAATTTLRVGSYVYDNDFRHPALLAKEAATIDVLSGGRLELGLGAGWHKEEYDAVGIPFDPPGVRVSRLEESVEILLRLFEGGPVTFEGTHYRMDGHEGLPTPIQRPIPLLIGGGGPRMLRLAAKRAQILGLVPPSLPGGGLDPDKFSAEAMDAKIAALEAAISEDGRIDGGPERSVLLFQMYPSEQNVPTDDWVRPDLVAESPYVLLGDPGAMVETLLSRRERWGLSYVVCFEHDLEQLLPVVRRLA